MFSAEEGKTFCGKVLYPMAWCFTNFGAIAMLYSRLHLIIDRPRALKWLAWTLLIVGVPFQVFLVVASSGNNTRTWYLGSSAHEVAYRLEIVFSLVEIALATAYIYFFTRPFGSESGDDNRFSISSFGPRKAAHLRRTFIVLILGEVFVIAGDIAIITVWLTGYFLVRLAIAPFIYGTKLKVEFLILNCLTGMTKQRAELRFITIETGNQANENVVVDGKDL